VFAAAAFWFSGDIAYTRRAGQLGPNLWPMFAAGLIAAVCIYEIVTAVAMRRRATGGSAETVDTESAATGETPTYPKRLIAGIVLTLGYGLLVPVLGFLVASFLYLVLFMYCGRYRSHQVIWGASVLGILVVALVFLKLVYVSLPRGLPPFDSVTDLVTGLF
jgi:hypothetical protein